MRKQSKKTLILIILFGIVLVGGLYLMKPKEETGVKLTVHYYDKDMNEILPPFEGFKGLSKLWIIGGEQFEPDYFALEIGVTNIGNLPFEASINSANPEGFLTALSGKTLLTLSPGQSGSWLSDPLAVADYVGNHEFKVWILAKTVAGYTPYLELIKTASRWLDIQSEGTVIFRTSDLTYSSGWIANYEGGIELTGYDYSAGSGILTGICSDVMPTKAYCGTSNTFLSTLTIGGWRIGGTSPSLWQSSESGRVCICDDDGSKYSIKKYEAPSTIAITSRNFQAGYEDKEMTTGGCVSNIQCGVWSECVEELQTRTCTDLNGCVSPYDEEQSCTIPICGDDIINQVTEECDGTDLGSSSCSNIGQGFTGGDLDCSECLFDTSGCVIAPTQLVVFRTNAIGGVYDVNGVEVVLDTDEDGILEAWTYSTHSIRTPRTCLVNTPEGYCVYEYVNRVYVHYDGNNAGKFVSGGTIPTTTEPTEPYASNGQETYS